MLERNLSYWLHNGEKPFLLATYWREIFLIGYILERNLSYWLHTGDKPYVLHTREKPFRIGYILEINLFALVTYWRATLRM